MPDPEIEREAPVDMTAGEAVPGRTEAAHECKPHGRRAIRVGAESQREPAELRLASGRPGDFNRRLQSQRHDIRAAVATGERRGDMAAIRQHNFGRLGFWENLLGGNDDIRPPQNAAARPRLGRVNACDKPRRGGGARRQRIG
jgi:hypothetical protein